MALRTNIVSDKELKSIMSETLQFLSDTLKNTLGPYGTTTIIQDRLGNHQITKDGYSLLKKIYIEEDEAKTILDLVKKISRNLVRKVGDGSTSSIIIANSLYKSLSSIMEKYHMPPKDLLTLLDEMTKVVEKMIKENSNPISDDMHELEYIAAVSTNNDLDYGKLVTDIFRQIGKYGFINLEKAKGEETYFEVTNGFELPRGWVLPCMVNKGDDKTCEYLDPKVLLCDDILTESDLPVLVTMIQEVCGAQAKPLVLIAKGFDNAFCTFLQLNIANNKIPLLAVELATENKKNQDRLKDLALNLGCDVYRKGQGEVLDEYTGFEADRLGSCKKVLCTDTFCRLIEGKGDKELIQERVDSLLAQLDEKTRNETFIDQEEEIFYLRKRVASLQNSMAVLYVGGASEDAKETDKYLLEDAVFACRSALNHGYIAGGNLIIPTLINDNKRAIVNILVENLDQDKEFVEDVVKSIKKAFLESFTAVLNNRFQESKSHKIVDQCVDEHQIYNLKKERFEDMDNTPIINSAETDIEILKSAISIIGLLATSNQFIRVNTIGF